MSTELEANATLSHYRIIRKIGAGFVQNADAGSVAALSRIRGDGARTAIPHRGIDRRIEWRAADGNLELDGGFEEMTINKGARFSHYQILSPTGADETDGKRYSSNHHLSRHQIRQLSAQSCVALTCSSALIRPGLR